MKAEAPKKAFKPEIGINYGQEDLDRFFSKLNPKKDQAQKGDKTAAARD